jgi:2-oxoisovalerate dehydrogenase E1 component beta subunit
MAQALRLALHVGEDTLGVTDIFGQDVGPPLGGVFTVTQGLRTAWNSPLDERGIIGFAYGIALAGGRPVCEIQFCDYIFNCIDMLKLAGNGCWTSAGEFSVPMVCMTPVGGGVHGSIYHSHSFESVMTHIAGWKVVCPSTPLDAYGLMLSAIEDGNPVMYLTPKALLRLRGDELIPGEPEDPRELRQRIDAPVGDRSEWSPDWPAVDPTFRVPLGQAIRRRTGTHATVVTYGRMAPLCVAAADTLATEGLSFDVLDLRTLFPMDWSAVLTSVDKTGRILVVNEDSEITNFGEHVLRVVTEQRFERLEARPRLLAGKHLPGVGLSPALEQATLPQATDVVSAMRAVAQEPSRVTARSWLALPEQLSRFR